MAQAEARSFASSSSSSAAGPKSGSVEAVYVRVRKVIEATCDAGNIKEIFNIAAEGSDVITKIQFKKFIQTMVKVYPGGHPDFGADDLTATFAFVDTDGNGTLDGDEFKAWFATDECASGTTGEKTK